MLIYPVGLVFETVPHVLCPRLVLFPFYFLKIGLTMKTHAVSDSPILYDFTSCTYSKPKNKKKNKEKAIEVKF